MLSTDFRKTFSIASNNRHLAKIGIAFATLFVLAGAIWQSGNNSVDTTNLFPPPNRRKKKVKIVRLLASTVVSGLLRVSSVFALTLALVSFSAPAARASTSIDPVDPSELLSQIKLHGGKTLQTAAALTNVSLVEDPNIYHYRIRDVVAGWSPDPKCVDVNYYESTEPDPMPCNIPTHLTLPINSCESRPSSHKPLNAIETVNLSWCLDFYKMDTPMMHHSNEFKLVFLKPNTQWDDGYSETRDFLINQFKAWPGLKVDRVKESDDHANAISTLEALQCTEKAIDHLLVILQRKEVSKKVEKIGISNVFFDLNQLHVQETVKNLRNASYSNSASADLTKILEAEMLPTIAVIQKDKQENLTLNFKIIVDSDLDYSHLSKDRGLPCRYPSIDNVNVAIDKAFEAVLRKEAMQAEEQKKAEVVRDLKKRMKDRFDKPSL